MRSIVAVDPFRCRMWAFHDRLEEHVNATTICEAWGRDVLDRLDDPSRRQAMIDAARALAKMEPQLQPREVHR